MLQLSRSNFQAHPYPLVSPSPWPIYTSISLLVLMMLSLLSFTGNLYLISLVSVSLVVFIVLSSIYLYNTNSDLLYRLCIFIMLLLVVLLLMYFIMDGISCDSLNSWEQSLQSSLGDSGYSERPVPGRRCPACLERGETVWVIPGKCCPQCGTPVN